MPNLDGGDVRAMRAKVEANVAVLLPHVRAGKTIVVPGADLRLHDEEGVAGVPGKRPETAEVAAATRDLMEFLDGLRREKKLKTRLREAASAASRTTRPATCARRRSRSRARACSRNAVPDTEVRIVEQCSAVDGTWGMKAAYYESGRKYAQKLVRGVKNSIDDAEAPVTVVTDCRWRGLRIEKENGVPALHPVEALATPTG